MAKKHILSGSDVFPIASWLPKDVILQNDRLPKLFNKQASCESVWLAFNSNVLFVIGQFELQEPRRKMGHNIFQGGGDHTVIQLRMHLKFRLSFNTSLNCTRTHITTHNAFVTSAHCYRSRTILGPRRLPTALWAPLCFSVWPGFGCI